MQTGCLCMLQINFTHVAELMVSGQNMAQLANLVRIPTGSVNLAFGNIKFISNTTDCSRKNILGSYFLSFSQSRLKTVLTRNVWCHMKEISELNSAKSAVSCESSSVVYSNIVWKIYNCLFNSYLVNDCFCTLMEEYVCRSKFIRGWFFERCYQPTRNRNSICPCCLFPIWLLFECPLKTFRNNCSAV